MGNGYFDCFRKRVSSIVGQRYEGYSYYEPMRMSLNDSRGVRSFIQ